MEGIADDFLDFEEILEYFTRRGCPKYAKLPKDDKEFSEKLVDYIILSYKFLLSLIQKATVPRMKVNEEVFKNKMKQRKEVEF